MMNTTSLQYLGVFLSLKSPLLHIYLSGAPAKKACCPAASFSTPLCKAHAGQQSPVRRPCKNGLAALMPSVVTSPLHLNLKAWHNQHFDGLTQQSNGI